MKKQVVYLISGPAHLPYLVVSLRSLRRHWDGEVAVHTWSDSLELVEQIATDKSLDITVGCREPVQRKRNAQFEDKILTMRSLNCDAAVYLDADTMVQKPINPLFSAVENCEFVATQFNDWNTFKGTIRKRLEKLRQFPEIEQWTVDTMLNETWPSVNGGVFACRPGSVILKLWYYWTKTARSIFISDETALHTMLAKFCPSGRLTIQPTGFNVSPKFQPKKLPDDGVAIWHFHGDCNVREAKSPKGVQIWCPEYWDCWKQNVGHIRDWHSKIHNRHLSKLLKDYGRFEEVYGG